MRYLLALDEGTSSARAVVFDGEAREVTSAHLSINCRYPNDGWVEQEADDIWRAQIDAARQAIDKAGIQPSQLAGIGIANQRETTIVWERSTGKPVGLAIVWQCRRTSDLCRSLLDAGHGAEVTRRTGLLIDTYFSATKIRWILDHLPDGQARADAGDLLFGTVDSWLVYKLTAGRSHLSDVTNASRTLLLNLDSRDWDEEMLQLFDVPRAMLPRIVPSLGDLAVTDGAILGAEVPIGGIAGDQQAALFGQACFRPGLSKNTYGTGCFMLMHVGGAPVVSTNRLISTLAASSEAERAYALEGSIFVAGAAIQWLRDSLGLLADAAESEALAQSVADTASVYFVPAFVGLGAPHWDPSARGVICGLTRSATRAHIVRAALEAIAYQTRELVEAMQGDAQSPISELRADGGAARNDFLMQFQADILGIPVVRPTYTETTALGAAFLAGLAAGVWAGLDEVEKLLEDGPSLRAHDASFAKGRTLQRMEGRPSPRALRVLAPPRS